MKRTLVMTILGKDKPGLVEKVATTIAQHNGNWLESRMCRLGGQFAGILKIHVESRKQKMLLDSLISLESQGIRAIINSGEDETSTLPSEFYNIEITGQDQPGIVSKVSKALAQNQINVEELHTDCVTAPHSGEVLFKAKARIKGPQFMDVDGLQETLGKIAQEMTVDFNLTEEEE